MAVLHVVLAVAPAAAEQARGLWAARVATDIHAIPGRFAGARVVLAVAAAHRFCRDAAGCASWETDAGPVRACTAQLVGPLAVRPAGTRWVARGTASSAHDRSITGIQGSTGWTSARGWTRHVSVQARDHRTGNSGANRRAIGSWAVARLTSIDGCADGTAARWWAIHGAIGTIG